MGFETGLPANCCMTANQDLELSQFTHISVFTDLLLGFWSLVLEIAVQIC